MRYFFSYDIKRYAKHDDSDTLPSSCKMDLDCIQSALPISAVAQPKCLLLEYHRFMFLIPRSHWIAFEVSSAISDAQVPESRMP